MEREVIVIVRAGLRTDGRTLAGQSSVVDPGD